MSWKIRWARFLFLAGLDAYTELLQAQIGARLLGAYIGGDYLKREEVEQWVVDQDHDLFMSLGYLEGVKTVAPWLYNSLYHYNKAQAIAVCVWKHIWRVKTYIEVEETQKTEHKADVGVCTLFEDPLCTDRDLCTDMLTLSDRYEFGDQG